MSDATLVIENQVFIYVAMISYVPGEGHFTAFLNVIDNSYTCIIDELKNGLQEVAG